MRFHRSIPAARCRSLTWSAWPEPSSDRALDERLGRSRRSQGAGVAGARRARHRGRTSNRGARRCRACWRAIAKASRSWRLRLAPTRRSPRLRPGWRLPKCGPRASRSRIALNGSQAPEPATLADLYTSELAPYVDLLVLSATADRAAASAHLLKVDREARLAILAGDAGDEVEAAARRIIDSQLDTVGTEVAVVAWRSSAVLAPALRRLAPIAPLLRRRHHGARRSGREPGAVACRPRRHGLDSPSAALRQPDLRDIPRLLGRRLAKPRST